MTKDANNQLKRKRTSNYGINFVGGYADGWFFGVPEEFKPAMDIRFLRYIDKQKSKIAREKLKEKTGNTKDQFGNLPTVYKSEWTRGIPPARSYDVGDKFYRPAIARKMVWEEAIKLLSHVVTVKAAQPDDDHGNGGWVEFELVLYSNSKPTKSSTHKASQSEFELFLQTGSINK